MPTAQSLPAPAPATMATALTWLPLLWVPAEVSAGLRTGLGTKYASLGMLYPADSVSADRAKGGWYRVSLDDRFNVRLEGWRDRMGREAGLMPRVSMRVN
ncbi:hypothetical protein [Streptomyces sp. NPDC051219]|uniref:hypothetical protein n=1 Tax=Streptomyces sp. NPDC051219 TaxID=3155283 RepID=UPI0034286424